MTPTALDEHGLSPRVRGNLHAGCSSYPFAGSIPACAGEPRRSPRRSAPVTVYPRVCGGTRCRPFARSSCCGLSPRVRGNLVRGRHRPRVTGSIPACAGEPARVALLFRLSAVYPRVCGGTRGMPAVPHHPQGLSPRVRGNPPQRVHPLLLCRSIPACAGEPNTRGRARNETGVYPRVCGGNRRCTASVAPWSWSIPACAGEPV